MPGLSLLLGAFATGAVFVQPEQLHVVLPRDAIPSIDRPTFEPASAARSLDSRKPVLGIVGDREQRAYSTWQLDRHEIVNDTFEGRAIAVTW
jgi:hypothetical protein